MTLSLPLTLPLLSPPPLVRSPYPPTNPSLHNAIPAQHTFPTSVRGINVLNRPDLQLVTTQTITFALPREALAGGGPCALRARFPTHWEVYDSSVEAGGPPLAVDIFDVDGPAAGALVGSVRFAALEVGGAAATINSFACRETMTYRFELAGVGEVGFVNGEDTGLGVDGGVEMVWGC
ncbi:hypothetical protein MMYC01_209731 [Madurella mycetomatis]|uniref:Ubiquitin 3 binding protein But2 C-terminal domain-containing protein n=1 Tax=Madurella mycetomatis TaxID=100816 RepID=A0A175VRJ9_9PEZI|nr:hypothetical protein MMYC01_209731 [Madurella mycetomatis]